MGCDLWFVLFGLLTLTCVWIMLLICFDGLCYCWCCAIWFVFLLDFGLRVLFGCWFDYLWVTWVCWFLMVWCLVGCCVCVGLVYLLCIC